MHDVHRRHRQERWLHTRISETLEDALKREAQRRRLPVSLFVRNVLEGALDLVEDLVGANLPETSRGPVDDGGAVYGWQEIVLNRGAACSGCGARVGGGEQAYRGLRDQPGPPIFLCPDCLRGLQRPATRKEEKP